MHIDIDNIQLKAICNQIPLLNDATLITPLKGGLTNINYHIDSPKGRFMMRLSDKTSELLGINRENERLNTIKAYELGLAPAVRCHLPSENVLLIDWIEGRTLNRDDFQKSDNILPRIAQIIKKLHTNSSFQGDFNFMSVRKQYVKVILENGYFMPDGFLEAEHLFIAIEKKIMSNPEKKVSCHNDLVAANFIDDGEKIWLIDFEYAGLNEPSFEIGNFSAEIGLTDAQLTIFCDTYWGKHLPSKIEQAKACSIITRAVWILWSCIQDAISPISFGFKDWAVRRWQTVLVDLHQVK